MKKSKFYCSTSFTFDLVDVKCGAELGLIEISQVNDFGPVKIIFQYLNRNANGVPFIFQTFSAQLI